MVDFIVCWKDPTLIIVFMVIVFDGGDFHKVKIFKILFTTNSFLFIFRVFP